MKTLIILLLFTFPLLLIIAFMRSFRRRRRGETGHDLLRLDHKNGDKCGGGPEKSPPPESSEN